MMMVRLPETASSNSSKGRSSGLALPVTSGLSMRRYPAFAAACPSEYQHMMEHDEEGADPVAEGFGIYIIARPASRIPVDRWGNVDGRALATGTGPLALDPRTAIVGDTHQYAPLYPKARVEDTHDSPSAAGVVLSDSIDEGLTDQMLRVACGMLQGVGQLLSQRRAQLDGQRSQAGPQGPATLLKQWHGIYLQHSDGVLNAPVAARPTPAAGSPASSSAGPGASFVRLHDDSKAIADAGLIKVVTGIGGKGMTMSPALAEENIEALYR